MNHFRLTISLAVFLLSFVGCTSGAYNLATVDNQAGDIAYCHKKLQPVGSTEPARPSQGFPVTTSTTLVLAMVRPPKSRPGDKDGLSSFDLAETTWMKVELPA